MFRMGQNYAAFVELLDESEDELLDDVDAELSELEELLLDLDSDLSEDDSEDLLLEYPSLYQPPPFR